MDSKTKEELLKLSLAMREARRAERREKWVKVKPRLSAAEQFVNRWMEGLLSPRSAATGEKAEK